MEKEGKFIYTKEPFKVVVGDPFVQYWCIDFGLLMALAHLSTKIKRQGS